MDGQKQRQALTAAERALETLVVDSDRAIAAARKAEAADQVGLFTGFVDSVAATARELADGGVTAGTRARLLDVVGPGPLQPLVEALPGR